jgi:hypothetical protein
MPTSSTSTPSIFKEQVAALHKRVEQIKQEQHFFRIQLCSTLQGFRISDSDSGAAATESKRISHEVVVDLLKNGIVG